ncbi:tRNA (guanosine(37)-N1)-methyltransferase TrmD [Actinomyces graevenitzii]|uniref:tRNA (guanosine(37)-N1)-methyltransferase TrmD n=1 Tax=Actinomyces graevenitzii TaxID=55565 RepID=UPI000C80A3C2|nr:tRNA (guanosine(37)-N1)-methyltransferase TrmD [Actinomyces graevenitzii]PMC91805.1 tRNA (guanosine(37)-N1)-methyltransferase TrmD [Actinomyces graevenitzii]
MRIDVVTIFPDYLRALDLSLIGKAIDAGKLQLGIHDLRDWTQDRHNTVDDTPAGGGAGMVMRPDVWGKALDQVLALPLTAVPVAEPTYLADAQSVPAVPAPDPLAAPSPLAAAAETTEPGKTAPHGAQEPLHRRVLVIPTPSGQVFTQRVAEELADVDQLVFACGRYEGIDARVAEHYQSAGYQVRELSIGDYVLNGGEVATLVMVEAIARLIPGVIGNPTSLVEESHAASGLLEYPVYTRPVSWRGLELDPDLLGGNHKLIARRRRDQALTRTATRRPDMIARLNPATLDRSDRALLAQLGWAALDGEHFERIKLRPARAEEIEALVQLGRATFPDACPAFLSDDDVQAFMDATFTPEQVASWVNSDDAALVVAERVASGQLLGYVLVERDLPDGANELVTDPRPRCLESYSQAELGYVCKLYLLPSVRGGGIAGALMDQAKKAAAAWGVKTMWLATHETNRRAQKLYKRYGFKNAGKRSFKVGSATCRDVVMVASL